MVALVVWQFVVWSEGCSFRTTSPTLGYHWVSLSMRRRRRRSKYRRPGIADCASATVESLAVASTLVPRLLGGVLRILALYRLARIVYRRAAERRSSETLEQRSSAVPECWCSGTPEQRSVGEREHSDAPRRPCRILALHPGNSAEPRSIATPEQWRAECRSNGAPEQQGTGAAELRSAGAAERRSSRTPKQWSAEAPEQQCA